MASTSGWDRDNVKVKGVDSGGTDREITAVQDGSEWRLAVHAKIDDDDDSDGISINPVYGQKTISFGYPFANGADYNQADSSGTTYYTVAPTGSDIWYLTGVYVYMAEAGGLVYDKFGNGATLTNGWELSIKTDGGTETTIYNVKNNAEIACGFLGGTYVGSSNAFSGLWKTDYPIILDASKSDFIRWKVQDDTSNTVYLFSVARLWKAL